jgi:hypothetical protein
MARATATCLHHGLAIPRQRLVRVAKAPQGATQIGQAAYSGVYPIVAEGLGAVLFGAIERGTLLQVHAGGDEVALVNRDHPEDPVRDGAEEGIVIALGEDAQLAGQCPRGLILRLAQIEIPLADEHGTELREVAYPVAELPRAREGVLGFGRRRPLAGVQRDSHRGPERQLLAIALGALRQGPEQLESFAEVADRLRQGRARRRPLPGLEEIANGPGMVLALHGMVREPLHVVDQAIRVQTLDGIDDLTVKRPPAVVKETPVGHVVGKRVLEGVFDVGETACLVHEFGGAEAREALAKALVRELGDRIQQGEWHVLADHRG